MHVDTRPQQVSACPVHFIWDGRGKGRPFVRAGFMGFLATGMAFTAFAATRSPALWTTFVAVASLSGASYGLGQLLSFMTTRAER